MGLCLYLRGGYSGVSPFYQFEWNWVDFQNCGNSGHSRWKELENDCEYAGLWENIVWGSREEKGGGGVG